MAKTYAYAIAGGLIATFTVAPVMAMILLPDKLSEVETWIVQRLRRVYEPASRFALANRIVTLGARGCCSGRHDGVRALGIEFLPHLEEGNVFIRAALPASISLDAGSETVNAIRRRIRSYPETEVVVSTHGRPDDGTDPTGFFNTEYFVPLKPQDEWPRAPDGSKMDKDKLVAIMSKDLHSFPALISISRRSSRITCRKRPAA
jgi:cobalt-zinc-cadmium resistance protein CzcA